MSNPFELMACGRPFDEVQKSIAHATASDLEEGGAAVTPDQLDGIKAFADKSISSVKVLDTLVCGATLYALSFITEPGFVRDVFDDMLEELSISRTQAYRCRAAWCGFGPQLQAEPGLKKFFCAEALKILSEERTPQSARNEALQLAREGQKVTIKLAEILQAQHGGIPASEPVAIPFEESPRKTKKRPAPKWQFVGSVARIEVIPTASQDLADVDAVIRDLEAAIAEWRNGPPSQQVV